MKLIQPAFWRRFTFYFEAIALFSEIKIKSGLMKMKNQFKVKVVYRPFRAFLSYLIGRDFYLEDGAVRFYSFIA